MAGYRYARWDGTQDPLGEGLPVDRLVEQLNEHLLEGWSPEWALRRLVEEGLPGRFGGLEGLRERLRRLREAQARRGGPPDPLAEAGRRLQEIKELEREALASQPDDEARFKELMLDALPGSVAAQIEQLRNYQFASPQAEALFAELLESIRRQVLDRHFRRLSDGLQQPSPEDLQRVKNMLADLNHMLEQRQAGTGPSQQEFDEFMQRHGDLFPENPRDLDELLEALARRAAAFSRLMASLSAEQRAELQALGEAILDDMDLAFELDRLSANLRELAPGWRWDRPVDLEGAEPLGLAEGLDAIERISDTEELERTLDQDYPGASLEDIDPAALQRALGEEAVRDLEQLRRIEQALEQAGVVVRSAGRLELTPRGVRKLGERALARVFARLAADQPGSHELPAAGGEGEPLGSSRPWRFGDAFRIDIRRSLHNAVLRSGPTTGPVPLRPDDFEVEEAERRTMVATVLLLDMSRSMPLRGHWIPAKRMALALHTLISTAYPEDHLSIVGFSDYARVMQPADLAHVDWEPVYGTNMEHAFHLAGRLLAKQRDATKQVLLITDGEPTAHLVGEHVFFQWPPVRETLERTYREAMRLCRAGVTMNIFMLERSPGLVSFVDRLAKLVRGRVFGVGGDDLGDMIVRDYVAAR